MDNTIASRLEFDFFKSSNVLKEQRRNEFQKNQKFNSSLPSFMIEVDEVDFEMVRNSNLPKGGGVSVRCDEEGQLLNWKEMIKRCYADAKILFNPTSFGYKIELVSEEFEKCEAIHSACMKNWIATGGSLD